MYVNAFIMGIFCTLFVEMAVTIICDHVMKNCHRQAKRMKEDKHNG